MTMTIDSIAEGSALLTFVKKHNLEYAERHLSNCNIELSVLLPHTLLKEFLEKDHINIRWYVVLFLCFIGYFLLYIVNRR